MSPAKKKPTLKRTKKFKVTPIRKSALRKDPKPGLNPFLKRGKEPVFDPEIRVYPTPALLFEETAPFVMQVAREAVDARGRFVLALSGGSTPKGLFQQLCEEPVKSLLPWDRTFVFWGDERHVPLTDEKSNYRMAQELLLSKVRIPKANVFPMTDGSRSVEQAASAYEGKFKKFFGMQMPIFDLNLMGMGDDGHTASLFPGVVQLNEVKHWVVGYFVDEEKKDRVSLTFPVLNASRVTLVLMEGAKKASRLKDVLEGPKDPPRYPIQYLKPTDGKLIFAMDAAAASLLKK
jgi:6-phosphogluconolactonase